MRIIKFTRRSDSGHTAGNEPTDASRAEYAACVERLEGYILSTVLFSDPALWAKSEAPKRRYQEYKATAVRILEECKRFEEGFTSGQGSNGEATQNAEKITEGVRPRDASIYRVVELRNGRQLQFDLFCINCHFQCWECPLCKQTRCACLEGKCACQLDGPNG